MTTTYIPSGGYGRKDGTVMTRSEVTKAVASYARKHGYYARTVRTVTILFRAAMREYRK